MKYFRLVSYGRLLALPGLLLFVLTACSSLQSRGRPIDSGGKPFERAIRIYNTVIGSSIALNPPVLQIAPGEGVVWINQTSYDVRINFDAGAVVHEGPSLIPRHSAVREKFTEAGTYTYTLLFSASKTFGRVNGEIIVSEPERQPHPPSGLPDNEPSPQPPSLGMPEII